MTDYSVLDYFVSVAEAGMVSVDAKDGDGFMERTATFSNGEDARQLIEKWCGEYSVVEVKSMDTGAMLFRFQYEDDAEEGA